MLTAKDGEYDQTDAFDLGADDYLTKPFSFMILIARLRALIRRGAPERPVLITVGTLVLDPARRSVERRGERDHPDRPGVRAAALPDAQRRRRGEQGRRSSTTSGTPPTRAATTSSRSTSATSDARSTHRSACRRCTLSAAWATGWTRSPAETGPRARTAGSVGAGHANGRARSRRRQSLRARVARSSITG